MRLIWATRGRNWGFRFLRDGGFADPLPAYDAAFAGIEAGPSAFQRVGTTVAVRLPDPLGRRDAAGRPIPHEFVVFSPLAEQVDTVGDVLELLWPRFADEYEALWDADAT